jgi:hypothetical protein
LVDDVLVLNTSDDSDGSAAAAADFNGFFLLFGKPLVS